MRTIRRSVYIGLGGTGVKAIAHVKKMYEDVFGDNIPNQIAFVAIDYDVCTLHDDALPTSMVRDLVPLPNLPIREIYFANKENGFATWMIPENEQYIPNHLGSGASQVRTSGRLITEMLMPNISSRIHVAIQQVMCLNVLDEEYAVHGDPKIDVHIATSLAGGTGSGSFINVALCVKEKFGSQVNIMGYGVLHGVFRAMDPGTLATPRVRLNSYSAVVDLDYLQSATPLNPVSLNVCGTPRVITDPLFDNFFLIDNVAENGLAINNVNVLCHHLASNMFHFGGDIGCVLRSFLFAEAIGGWKHGWYDFRDKKGWVQRLGFCQIVYDGERLAGLYAQKAKIELIRQSLCGGSDVDQMAAEWCESNGLGASETHDRLIDVIFSPAEFGNIAYPNLNIEVRDEEMYDELGKYLDNFQNFPTKESLLNLRERILEELKSKVADLLNSDGGVADAQTFLAALARICSGYKREMEDERQAFISSIQTKEAALEVECNAYNWYSKKPWPLCTKSGKAEHLEALASAAKGIIKAKIEARRREEAAEVFMVLLNEINNLLSEVKSTNAILDSLIDVYSAELVAQQNLKQNNHLFEYDLSVEEGLNMTIGENEISLTDFMSSLAKPFAELTKEEIDLALDAFAASLPRCEQYRTTLINDVIQDLSSEDYMKLKAEVAQRVSPLLPLQCRCPENMMTSKKCVVSIYRNYSEGRSRLENDQCLFERGIDCRFIPSDAPEMRQKVVFFRIDSAVIPYCLEAFDASIEHEYDTCLRTTPENTRFNPHFDLQIYEEMKRKDFKLRPKWEDEVMF